MAATVAEEAGRKGFSRRIIAAQQHQHQTQNLVRRLFKKTFGRSTSAQHFLVLLPLLCGIPLGHLNECRLSHPGQPVHICLYSRPARFMCTNLAGCIISISTRFPLSHSIKPRTKLFSPIQRPKPHPRYTTASLPLSTSESNSGV